MTKKEALAIFKRAGFEFTGFKDAGWGEKRYHFTHPNINGETSYDLSLLRTRARMLDIQMWHDEYLAELKQGIQEDLFTDLEIELNYTIENPLEVAA